MPNVTGTTRAQTNFLRAYAKNSDGPPADLWPSPAVFRKWLRRPRFARALESILAAVRYQTDLHLAHAACNTAKHIAHAAASPPATKDQPPGSKDLAPLLLRLHHLRQRFPAHPAQNGKPDDDSTEKVISEREFVRSISGDEGVHAYDELVAMRKERAERERREPEQAQSPKPPPATDENDDDDLDDSSPTL
jgi:hypothetical protein